MIESHRVSDQGVLPQETDGDPTGKDRNGNGGLRPQINPENAPLSAPSFSAGPDGHPHKGSAYQEKRRGPAISEAGGPKKHVRKSANVEFPLDEKAHSLPDLAEHIEVNIARGPEQMIGSGTSPAEARRKSARARDPS